MTKECHSVYFLDHSINIQFNECMAKLLIVFVFVLGLFFFFLLMHFMLCITMDLNFDDPVSYCYIFYCFQEYQIMVMPIVGMFQWNNVKTHIRLIICWEISVSMIHNIFVTSLSTNHRLFG